MHKVALNQAVIDEVLARRGRRHAFADLDPHRTALIVIDLQNAFMDAGVTPNPCQHAIDIVPNVNRIAATLRDANGVIVWVQNAATRQSQESWSVLNVRMFSPQMRDRREARLQPGTIGHSLWPSLDVQNGDMVVQKTRFSAFIPGASDLETRLRKRGVNTLIVTGTGTETCCESTARDAMMLNFAVIMVSDATASDTDERHNASLNAFYRNFGDVMSTEEVVGFIRSNVGGQARSKDG